MTQWNAQINIVAKDLASPQIRRVTGRMNRMTAAAKKSAFSIRGAFGRMGAGFARLEIGRQVAQLGDSIAGMGMKFADEAGGFEQGLASIQAITRASASEMGELRNASLQAAMTMPFKPEETISTLQDMATKGLNAKDSMAALIPTLDLAAGSMGQLGLAGAGDAVVGTMNAMGWQTDSLTKITDKLLRTTQLTNFQTRDFELGLARSVASANQYGQSLDDTLVLIGLLRNMNIEASVASTALRESWRKLASDHKKQQMVQELGIDLFDKQTGAVRPFLDVMAEAAVALEGVTEKERLRFGSVVFGARGLAAFNAVSNAQARILVDGEKKTLRGKDAINAYRMQLLHTDDANREMIASNLEAAIGIDNLSSKLQNATGTALGFRKAVLDTYKGQQQLIESVKATARILTGEGLAYMMKPVLSAFVDFWRGISNAINSLPPETRGMVMAIVTGFGMLLKFAGGLAIVTGLMYAFGFGIKALLVGFGQFLLTLVPATILLVGFGTAFYALYRSVSDSSGGIRFSLQDLKKQFRMTLQGIGEIISKGSISEKLDAELGEGFARKIIRWFGPFYERWKSFWEGLKQGFEIGIQALGPQVDGLIERFGALTDLFGGEGQQSMEEWRKNGVIAGEEIAKFGGNAIEILGTLVDVAKDVGKALAGITAEDVRSFIEGFRTVFTTITDIFGGIKTAVIVVVGVFRGLVGAVTWALGGIAELLSQAILTMINKVKALWNFIQLVPQVISGKMSFADAWKSAKQSIVNVLEDPNGESPFMKWGSEQMSAGFGAVGDRTSSVIGQYGQRAAIEEFTWRRANAQQTIDRLTENLGAAGRNREWDQNQINELTAYTKRLDETLKKIQKEGITSRVEFAELAAGVRTAAENSDDRSYAPAGGGGASTVGFGV